MPWTTRSGFVDLLRVLADLDIVENVGPVQLALRLTDYLRIPAAGA